MQPVLSICLLVNSFQFIQFVSMKTTEIFAILFEAYVVDNYENQ